MKKALKRLLGVFLIILSVSVIGGTIQEERLTEVYSPQGVIIGTKITKTTFKEGFVKTFIGGSIMASVATVFFYGIYLLIEDRKW